MYSFGRPDDPERFTAHPTAGFTLDSDSPGAAGRVKDVKGPTKSEKHRKPEEFVRKQEEENAPTK